MRLPLPNDEIFSRYTEAAKQIARDSHVAQAGLLQPNVPKNDFINANPPIPLASTNPHQVLSILSVLSFFEKCPNHYN